MKEAGFRLTEERESEKVESIKKAHNK